MLQHAFLALAALATSTLAQTNNNNSSSNSNTTCGTTRYDIAAPVNSSAQVIVRNASTPWYLTSTLNDTRSATTADHSITGFLSVPPDTSAYACVFLMTALLPALTGNNGDCAGALSASCVDFIRSSVVVRAGDMAAKRCPSPPGLDALKEACGDPLGKGLSTAYSGIDVSNTTCARDRVPGPDQPPQGYSSFGLFGISGFAADESDRSDPTKFTWYGKYKSQAMPWIVAGLEGSESWTSVVCVVPGKVEAKSAATRVGGAWVGVGVAVMVAVWGLL
ncbi:hypothetical protein C7974DRAFT_384411 [Boeremia exigua]|uniref:uncharacterized protein n=1 Tax=Boeremia exigua TaxID=749465 RepID=UPI001E8D69B4|nr:uncharacterized protein C7974DRAFT_384411 [Boeremia exigua]KAH6644862.1 hypothetical protein C7974DRAFT_384411 [Boeremia exigua]